MRQIYLQETPQNLQKIHTFCTDFLHLNLTPFALFFTYKFDAIRTVYGTQGLRDLKISNEEKYLFEP